MRVKLTLQPKDQPCVIPINYQYPLSAAIYKILATASPDYAEFLHDKGYLSPAGKPLKLFTFSRIMIKNFSRINATLQLTGNSQCTLLISSPMLEDFIQHFVIGLFQQQEIVIGGRDRVGRLMITQVETLPVPEFEEEMKFTCLSPIVASTMHEYHDRITPYYYRPGDEGLSDAIQKNLKSKFEVIFKTSPEHLSVEFQIDPHYLTRRKQQGKRVTKKITIKEADAEHATDIIGFEAPFKLSGHPELMRIAYDCGIGEKNSLGFGMIEIVE